MPKYLLAASLLFLLACKKKAVDEYELLPPSNRILTLQLEPTGNERQRTIRWSKYIGADFLRYEVVRVAYMLTNGDIEPRTEVLKAIENTDELAYTDDVPEGVLEAMYYVVVYRAGSLEPVPSEAVATRYNGYFYRAQADESVDIFIDTDAKILYFAGTATGILSSLSYTTKRQLAIDTIGRPLAYGSLAVVPGQQNRALYIPTSDGWLHVLDPQTLATRMRLFVEELGITSVIAAGNSLVVATHQGNYGGKVKVYDIATNTLTDEVGYHSFLRLYGLSARSFISLSQNLLPVEATRFELDGSGNIAAVAEDTYHGDYPLDPNRAAVAPDGSRFVTSGEGAIYTGALVYERTLAPWYGGGMPKYVHYAFNEDGSTLYAAVNNEHIIEEIASSDGSVTRQLSTVGYPQRIFKDGDQLVVVCQARSYVGGSYYFVEVINL